MTNVFTVNAIKSTRWVALADPSQSHDQGLTPQTCGQLCKIKQGRKRTAQDQPVRPCAPVPQSLVSILDDQQGLHVLHPVLIELRLKPPQTPTPT